MSRIDQITLKGPLSGNKRSHAMNSSRRVWNVNLQTIRLTDNKGRVHKIRVSARTIKTLNHTRIKKVKNNNIEK